MNGRFDAGRCPLCGEANGCAMDIERTTGIRQGPCWCTGVDFTSELLAQVPAAAQGTACICAACAAKQLSPPDGSQDAP